jgi:hypothetical protein
MFETPILLLIFNRPQTARKVFEQIKAVKPKYLYIAADGPRHGNIEDIIKCAETRTIINDINWDCEIKTLFKDENRGCGQGPAEAITWFFEHVEQGIILEDDCLAINSFFTFCEEALELYKHDERIFLISGFNPLGKWGYSKNTYSLSLFGGTWGWATWKRAWSKFDYSASLWKNETAKNKVKSFLQKNSYFNHFSQEFDEHFNPERHDVWDFQWLFCRLYNESYSIVPNINLIKNIGFDSQATHTNYPESSLFNMNVYDLLSPIKHNRFKINTFYDWYIFERTISKEKRTLLKKFILKLIKLIYS